MASLFEQLQDRLNQTQTQPGQQQISNVLQTKTGKVGAARPAQSSGIQAGAAQAAGREGLRQLSTLTKAEDVKLQGQEEAQVAQFERGKQALETQKETAEQKLAAREIAAASQRGAQRRELQIKLNAKEQQQVKDIAHQAKTALAKMAVDYNITATNLYDDLQTTNKELSQRRDAALIHQRTFLAQLANDAYVAELNRIGKQRQLNVRANWELELQRLVFGEELHQLQQEYDYMAEIDAATRAGNEVIAMTNEQARAILMAMQTDSANATTVANSFSAGTTAAAGIDWKKITASDSTAAPESTVADPGNTMTAN